MSVIKQKDLASDRLGYAAKAAGSLVMLLGGAVMVGWFMDSTALIQLRPQLVPMQFNTALGFVLCATGLLSLLYKQLHLAIACGVLLAGLALATLLQYPLGADFGIDRLLFEPDITTKSTFPGRMAPTTAIAHLLSGLTLLALAGLCHLRACLLMVRISDMGVLALGLGNLLGYVVGGETPYGWSHSTYMAVHTAVGFTLLGAGLLAFTWRRITGVEQRKSRSLALESGTGLAILTVILWQSLLTQERLQSTHFVESQAAHLSAEIEDNIDHQILALSRMARRWEDQGGAPQPLWRADAARYLQDNPGLQAISWVDSSMVVRWVESLQGNEAARDLHLDFEPRRTQALETARLERAVTATRTIELVQGGKAFIAYFPLYIDDRFDGYIGAVFRINKLLDSIVTKSASKGFELELFEDNEAIYRRVEPGAVYEPTVFREQTLDIVNHDWRLRLQPSQALLAELGSPLPRVELMVGLLLALLLGLVVDRAHAARQRSTALAIEVAERKQAEEELRRHREHLEELVADRTRELEDSRQQLRDLAVHLQTVREEERARIARDVHDELGQVLTALNMDVHWLQEHLTENQAEVKRKALLMHPLIASAIESVQRITSELRPAMLDELGLGPAVQWYLDDFQERTGIKTGLTIACDEMQIDSDRATAVFRILQEALTNVARHAGAGRVNLDIRVGDGYLEVQLRDNGRGIRPSATSAGNALGLLGMRERALVFGGCVDIVGHSGGGTTVSLHLPLGINLAAC